MLAETGHQVRKKQGFCFAVKEVFGILTASGNNVVIRRDVFLLKCQIFGEVLLGATGKAIESKVKQEIATIDFGIGVPSKRLTKGFGGVKSKLFGCHRKRIRQLRSGR